MFLVALGTGGYSVAAGATVYQRLDTGRDHLVRARDILNEAARGELSQVPLALPELLDAEQAFMDAAGRVRGDIVFRSLGHVPAIHDQVRATAHLAAIGVDLSRALRPVAQGTEAAVQLKERYGGRPLTLAEGIVLLQQADALATQYAWVSGTVQTEVRAAHEERSLVKTTTLVPALRLAYDQVDETLALADDALLRYQNMRQVLSQVLGLELPRS